MRNFAEKYCVRRLFFGLFQLFEKVRRLEVLGYGVIHTGYDLVDGLFPALFGVLAALDGAEELAEGLLHHVSEVRRNLERIDGAF